MPKARITVQGFNDPDLFTLERDAPTVQPLVVTVMMQVIASLQWLLFGGDIKSAFLQGGQAIERQERLFMYQPLDGFLKKLPDIDPTVILEVVGSVPGLVNCPRLFYNHLRQVMISLGWHRHSLDACCFLYLDQGAIIAAVCVHVDDVIGGIAQTTPGRRVMKALQEAFTWGKWATEKVEFCGRRYRQVENGISIDQQDYTEGAEFTRTLPARARQVHSPLTPEEDS